MADVISTIAKIKNDIPILQLWLLSEAIKSHLPVDQAFSSDWVSFIRESDER